LVGSKASVTWLTLATGVAAAPSSYTSQRVKPRADAGTPRGALAGSLTRIARSEGTRAWTNADIEEAEPLLLDRRRCSSHEEISNDLERVYYVNVDNLIESSLIGCLFHCG
jgi:hypothetical protein